MKELRIYTYVFYTEFYSFILFIDWFISSPKDIFSLILEKEEEGERQRERETERNRDRERDREMQERDIDWLSSPVYQNWGLNMQPEYVP